MNKIEYQIEEIRKNITYSGTMIKKINFDDCDIDELIQLRFLLNQLSQLMTNTKQNLDMAHRNINNLLHEKCNHKWVIDRADISERTTYVCEICGSDNF
jgi:hypothetical protein